MTSKIRKYILATKYWLQGDDWQFAVEYADAIVNGWKAKEVEK